MFTNKDVVDYYHNTQNHYETHWKLKEAEAIHYGFWFPNTKNFVEALINTNKEIIKKANLTNSDFVLDAGCGIGGTLNFLAQQTGCSGIGITLAEKQVAQANALSAQKSLQQQTSFEQGDYLKTRFNNNSFTVAYAMESMCYANEKLDFLTEMHRILKPGGKLVVFDYFLEPTQQQNPQAKALIKQWLDLWAVDVLDAHTDFEQKATKAGFSIVEAANCNQQVAKSVKRMSNAYYFGVLPATIYNSLFKVSAFAAKHHKVGYYQHKAFKKGYWNYMLYTLQKN
jgi:tocopherol O-methyltransferase